MSRSPAGTVEKSGHLLSHHSKFRISVHGRSRLIIVGFFSTCVEFFMFLVHAARRSRFGAEVGRR